MNKNLITVRTSLLEGATIIADIVYCMHEQTNNCKNKINIDFASQSVSRWRCPGRTICYGLLFKYKPQQLLLTSKLLDVIPVTEQ